MKPTKYIIILFASMIVFTCSTQAQKGRIERANLLYEYQSFAEAIPKYKKCLRKDSNNKEVLIKLADCYRRVNDVDNAAKYYGKIIEKGYAESIHKYHYAQALMSIDKNADAKKYMEEYNVDKRGKTFVKSIDYFERFYKDSADYKIQVVPFNLNRMIFLQEYLKTKLYLLLHVNVLMQRIISIHGQTTAILSYSIPSKKRMENFHASAH